MFLPAFRFSKSSQFSWCSYTLLRKHATNPDIVITWQSTAYTMANRILFCQHIDFFFFFFLLLNLNAFGCLLTIHNSHLTVGPIGLSKNSGRNYCCVDPPFKILFIYFHLIWRVEKHVCEERERERMFYLHVHSPNEVLEARSQEFNPSPLCGWQGSRYLSLHPLSSRICISRKLGWSRGESRTQALR